MFTRLLTSVAALGLTAGVAAAEYQLTILHTNDFHSRFEPISKYDSGCREGDNAEGKCFGGSARLVTALAEARARSNNSILVDGGDQFQGSLYYTYYKGKVAAEMMNKLGYDGMTVGNHEFDDGPEVLRGFMDSVEFPVLMSNADVSAEPALADVLKKSIVIERGGEKIGLIGLTPEDTPDLASPGKNITFTNPVDAVQGEVDKLTAEGVNKIIVLSHSGYAVDQKVAANTTGVDVIVGGHSNTYLSNVSDKAAGPYPTMVNDVAIVQAYAYGKFLGELNVTFDDEGNVIEAKGEPLIMDGNVAEDAETVARIAELAKPLDEIRTKVVAEASAAVEGDRSICRVQECEMGNLVADAMLDRVKDQGVSIAIANSGGIRASLEPGEVTMGEVLTILPFQNTLSTFEISGEGVVAALENGVSQVEEVKGRFPQVAGLKFTWDPSVAPNEGRVQEVMVAEGDGYVAIDPAKTYVVVTNNYVRNGGDGYKMFAGDDKNAYDFGPDLADVLAEYLAEQGPYTPYTDGRISQK
ncbi:multifunctional 2',3'-cyclic-nucleotide 2'-phosphodiesterase/5'-nucleotidase/3'-nucleotidase [Rhodobacteraceae bacterium R_SAG1]|jgi:5'-nucleotidase|uniref:bifunctional metallophosphatase/5'-nucleotidase n=1 Tax=Phaeobacter italicus TaxID=481446 RepID=UPI0006193A06|nr:bifunctional metallophosphatase/5'-nucleotidase [Phaeobacter italicus]NKX70475.1 multifunctional 2',3'-cyclic-nucleotide 2'-phosphodiesterase/5'-nucleotidase/3'-nucleotidase [Rhodobacteraceae bacterium R_SAG1]MBO9440568.1 5'-nucleotidase C-terminal domain-containing protein [Phaeobacter italicus]MBY5975316.1 5'-nucleotidase/apyrase family protein [Phaeobacter italicus]MBY6042981.1 5'-nucleotidase/apyrase family protein [Phaeobacter italicus]GLO74775.1 multifunctional 2',3'-cyclic-nucleotide